MSEHRATFFLYLNREQLEDCEENRIGSLEGLENNFLGRSKIFKEKNKMEFIRVESVSERIFCVFALTHDEYARIIRERNERAERERENEIDRERERQWYIFSEEEYTNQLTDQYDRGYEDGFDRCDDEGE